MPQVNNNQPEDFFDVNDPELTPSWHGKECQGNGLHPGIECCCDECAYFLICWPDWNELNETEERP